MIRVRIGYDGMKKKVLWFDKSIEFPLLLRKIVNKLGVTHERDDGDNDLIDLFQIRLEDESLPVREVDSIEYGDEIVLERKDINNKPVKKENSDDSEQNIDSGDVTKKSVHPVKKENADDDDDDDVISISSDEDEDEYSSYNDNTDEEYESSSSEGEDSEGSYTDYSEYFENSDYEEVRRVVRRKRNPNAPKRRKSEDSDGSYSYYSEYSENSDYEEVRRVVRRKRNPKRPITNAPKRRKRNPKTPIEPPLEVIMEKRDIPSAPGKSDHRSEIDMEEKSMLVDGTGKKKSEQEVKDRIIKLLNTGFHDQSNENEAKNAMKLAQRLMRKHNLSQALLLKERETKNSQNAEDQEILKGGMVKLKIINRKTRKASLMSRWISRLTHPMCENFGVRCYTQTRRGVACHVVFYGIYSNAQLAGYAFKVATERISQMMTEYQPEKSYWRGPSTKSSRLSYAIGIVQGISEDVERNLRMEKEQRKRKLERARLAGSKGEAYAESDDEDFGVDEEGPGMTIVKEEAESDGAGSRNPLSPSHASSGDRKPDPQPKSISGIDLENRVEELEKEEQAALVLVSHNEKVAEEVLKENDIKLSTQSRRKPIQFDHKSYSKGIEDSKEIDINQRAIRDEVKVKVEKT